MLCEFCRVELKGKSRGKELIGPLFLLFFLFLEWRVHHCWLIRGTRVPGERRPLVWKTLWNWRIRWKRIEAFLFSFFYIKKWGKQCIAAKVNNPVSRLKVPYRGSILHMCCQGTIVRRISPAWKSRGWLGLSPYLYLMVKVERERFQEESASVSGSRRSAENTRQRPPPQGAQREEGSDRWDANKSDRARGRWWLRGGTHLGELRGVT